MTSNFIHFFFKGGPHNNNIAGVAVALKHAHLPEFKQYAQQVINNAKALAKFLQGKGKLLYVTKYEFVSYL